MGYQQYYFKPRYLICQKPNKNMSTNMGGGTQWPKDRKHSIHSLIFKKGGAQNYKTIALISHTSDAQGGTTKTSTLYRERNTECSSWIQKRKTHLRPNQERSLDTGVL